MDEQASSTTSLQDEGLPEDCFDHLKRREIGGDVFRNRAIGDDAGSDEFEWPEEIEEDA